MSSRQRELFLILATYADWDPRHDRFGLVHFTRPDLAEFADLELWSCSTFKRTISDLIKAGEIKRVKYGEYLIVKMNQFLSGHLRDRARKGPLAGQDGPRVGHTGPQVVHSGPQVGQFKKSSVGSSGPKNVKNLKKESTGDFFLDSERHAECPHLSALKRVPLLTATAQAFPNGAEHAKAGSAIVDFHAARISRGLNCKRTDCLEALVDLLESVKANARANPLAYLEKGLAGLLEDATDAQVKEKEAGLCRRPSTAEETHVAAKIVDGLRLTP